MFLLRVELTIAIFGDSCVTCILDAFDAAEPTLNNKDSIAGTYCIYLFLINR